ncbi:MAG: hypothetical protein KZQ59_16545 [Candidatus Thiodiazotropha sp. (ex Lucinoma aequizonata)]|nr:hypothetical protein [Candidatus Thiodiazotropha sp. (ex Lucinoma aequizonata)]
MASKNKAATKSSIRLLFDNSLFCNYSAKKPKKVLDKVFLYFFRFERRLSTCTNNHSHKQQEACYGFLLWMTLT